MSHNHNHNNKVKSISVGNINHDNVEVLLSDEEAEAEAELGEREGGTVGSGVRAQQQHPPPLQPHDGARTSTTTMTVLDRPEPPNSRMSATHDGRIRATTKRTTTNTTNTSTPTYGDTLDDHYTLPMPSSWVRFRGTHVRVHEFRSSQLQLVEMVAGSPTTTTTAAAAASTHRISTATAATAAATTSTSVTRIVVKQVPHDNATGLNLLRLSYTLVGFFYVGFLFLVCFQVVLFAFMNLIVDAGLTDSTTTNNDASVGKFLGTLCSIPIFLYGLSTAMALGAAFLSDLWNGHVWMRQLLLLAPGNTNTVVVVVVATEWLAFGTLLGIPLVTCIILLLFLQSNGWWKITLLTWFCCVTVYYVVFSLVILYLETHAAWLVLTTLLHDDLPPHQQQGTSSTTTARRTLPPENAAWMATTAAATEQVPAQQDQQEQQQEFYEQQSRLSQEPKPLTSSAPEDRRNRRFMARTFWKMLAQAIQYRQLYQYSGQSNVQMRFTTQRNESRHDAGRKHDEEDNDAVHNDKDENDSKNENVRNDSPVEHDEDSSITPNLWARLTLLTCWSRPYSKPSGNLRSDQASSCFERLHRPQRVYSLSEILGTQRFVTAQNWSLEKLFCSSPQHSSAVVVVKGGPAALHPRQIQASLICQWMGIALVLLLGMGALVWVETSVVVIVLLAVLIVACCGLGRLKSSYRIHRLYQSIHQEQQQQQQQNRAERSATATHDGGMRENEMIVEDEVGDDDVIVEEEEEEEGAIYQVYEQHRLTRPTPRFAWFMFVVEIGVLIVFPMITLLISGNYPISILFIALSLISFVRYYLNPGIFLQELGSMDRIFENTSQANDNPTLGSVGGRETRNPTFNQTNQQRRWNEQSRLYQILTHVTQGPSRTLWINVFVLLVFGVALFTLGALSQSAEDSVSDADEIILLPRNNYSYPPQPNLPYPTCALAKGLGLPGGNATALADYAFLAVMAYQPPGTFQDKLDQWFGPRVAKDELGIVLEFRQRVQGGNAAVSYHLVTFPEAGGAVLVVRGSTTAWEWLTDAQLWSGAAIAQAVRGLMPIGEVFTPIIHQLLKAVSILESDNLDEVALYRQTTQFIRELQSSGNYTWIHITGQSLGGGITLITAAQTGIPGIAISGPNNKLSRKTFDPSFSEGSINQFLFNVIPQRDIIPRIDDVGMQHQQIQCRAKKNDLFGCHSSIRSLCEIMYTCGSYNRPPLCECATKFGYPEAQNVVGDSTTFTDFCGECRTNDGYYSSCS
ncbi:hypothetical protein ACA910_005158 [Epithemia clementina (nom. ined.)]